MDCREASLLITLRLDGAISKDEEAALAAHLAGCQACSREMALQERLSGALREIGRDEVQAPAELCGLVMGRLRAERKIAFAWLPAAWRRVMAAAAAVLIVAGGSAGVTAGLKVAGGGKMIGLGTPAKVEVEAGGAAPANGEVPPGRENPAGAPVAQIAAGNAQGGNAPVNNEGNSAGGSVSAVNDAAGVKPGANGGTTSPPRTDPVSMQGPGVLLSSNMKVTSTVLKVVVGDLAEARARAVALAAGAGAQTQVFPEQGGGKKIVIIRITAESGQAPALIAGLGKLGTLADRQDESRDITALYNETMVQYSDLQSRIGSVKDAAERQQLEAQAASYKRQLDAWEAKADKRVIMLWLESS
ncbi:MAG: zf-HC2 domain-containing protein [Firmicutes bacterium]|nr:zf-HC2 domain-containing protein [Bacillota bacterium]